MKIESGILEGCIREDRRAQAAFYRQCFSLLMSVSIRYVKQEADAVALVNLGFLKILQNLERKKANVPLEAWIRRIMINTIIDEFRKHRRYRETHQQTEFTDTDRYDSYTDLNEAALKMEAEALEALIQRLPSMSQQVFNLYAIDGYSHKEIAEMLGMSDGTSKWHVAFARKKLKQWLVESQELSKTLSS
ncbi:MAG: RNA polymerase sigma factor [Bacteroidota bacterium]